jgi:hypothetical protein
MKTYLLKSRALLLILLMTSLTGCKKTDDAAMTPQLSCQAAEYVSLDGTSNANKYSYKFTYGADGRPLIIDYVYGNFDPKTAQKGGWTYNYQTPGKVVIDQTLEGKHYTTSTLSLDDQGRATRREDGDGPGAKVTYDYVMSTTARAI